MLDTEQVKEFLLEQVKSTELQPKKDTEGKVITSYCNYMARRVAEFFGCENFSDPDLLADDMVHAMIISGDWTFTTFGEIAAKWAQIGGLAFAAMTSDELGEEHGHIAPVFPGIPELSPSLGIPVPQLANVGAKNGVMLASEAFPGAKWPLGYYLWKLSI